MKSNIELFFQAINASSLTGWNLFGENCHVEFPTLWQQEIRVSSWFTPIKSHNSWVEHSRLWISHRSMQWIMTQIRFHNIQIFAFANERERVDAIWLRPRNESTYYDELSRIDVDSIAGRWSLTLSSSYVLACWFWLHSHTTISCGPRTNGQLTQSCRCQILINSFLHTNETRSLTFGFEFVFQIIKINFRHHFWTAEESTHRENCRGSCRMLPQTLNIHIVSEFTNVNYRRITKTHGTCRLQILKIHWATSRPFLAIWLCWAVEASH